MYISGLVPRKMAMLGLVGGPLIILSGTLVMFGVADAGGALWGIATIPEGVWELSLGIYCTLKGFRPSSPILPFCGSAKQPMMALFAGERTCPTLRCCNCAFTSSVSVL